MKFLEQGCLVGADRSSHDVRFCSLFLFFSHLCVDTRQKYHLVDVFGENGRNIVTHHAEDGSGMGSTIVANVSG
ncbi:hypothetical protein B0H14DRAFT_2976395 [Mycena olivaceomarginata]|nr:hypothetical protein B0H14DRAFT_2976395 [Mycena olivaceomarginata]